MNSTGVGASVPVPESPLNGVGYTNAARQPHVLACSPLAVAFPAPAAAPLGSVPA